MAEDTYIIMQYNVHKGINLSWSKTEQFKILVSYDCSECKHLDKYEIR